MHSHISLWDVPFCFIWRVCKSELFLPHTHAAEGKRMSFIRVERMTARALIVNHWQHYWTSPPLPIWICVGRQGGPCYKSFNNTHLCASSSENESTTAPPNVFYTDTCPHAQKHTANYNKCGSVDHPSWQLCFLSSALIFWCIVWIMQNKRSSRTRISDNIVNQCNVMQSMSLLITYIVLSILLKAVSMLLMLMDQHSAHADFKAQRCLQTAGMSRANAVKTD